MHFGELMSRLRQGAGITEGRVANKAGLSLRTVQSWEQGRRAPVSPDFFKLVAALGVSADAFAGIAAHRPGNVTGTARDEASQGKAGKGPARGRKPAPTGRARRTGRGG